MWDEHWYAGHDLPGYSLLFPPLASLLGMRLVAVLCVLASRLLFERLALAAYGAAARWGAVCFAVAARRRRVDRAPARSRWASPSRWRPCSRCARGQLAWAVALALLCAAASPVAGVLLALAGLTHALTRRSPRTAARAGGCRPLCVVVPLALLFPEGGFEPYPILSFAADGRSWWRRSCGRSRAARGCCAWARSCTCVACVAVPARSTRRWAATSSATAVLLAGPLLLCSRLAPSEQAPARRPRSA